MDKRRCWEPPGATETTGEGASAAELRQDREINLGHGRLRFWRKIGQAGRGEYIYGEGRAGGAADRSNRSKDSDRTRCPGRTRLRWEMTNGTQCQRQRAGGRRRKIKDRRGAAGWALLRRNGLPAAARARGVAGPLCAEA